MEKGIWLEIEELYKEFQQLGISQSVDYEKYSPLFSYYPFYSH